MNVLAPGSVHRKRQFNFFFAIFASTERPPSASMSRRKRTEAAPSLAFPALSFIFDREAGHAGAIGEHERDLKEVPVFSLLQENIHHLSRLDRPDGIFGCPLKVLQAPQGRDIEQVPPLGEGAHFFRDSHQRSFQTGFIRLHSPVLQCLFQSAFPEQAEALNVVPEEEIAFRRFRGRGIASRSLSRFRIFSPFRKGRKGARDFRSNFAGNSDHQDSEGLPD